MKARAFGLTSKIIIAVSPFVALNWPGAQKRKIRARIRQEQTSVDRANPPRCPTGKYLLAAVAGARWAYYPMGRSDDRVTTSLSPVRCSPLSPSPPADRDDLHDRRPFGGRYG